MLLQNMKEVKFNGKFKSRNGVSMFEMDNEESELTMVLICEHCKEKKIKLQSPDHDDI